MKRFVKLGLVLAVAVIVTCGAYYASRNPEQGTLDDAARAAVPGQYVRLTDGLTHFELSGPEEGPPVVLVHGFSVPAYIWDSTVALLSGAGFRVLRYDLFGRGTSDRPDVTYDADLFDRQLGELLDSARWQRPVHVMGLSMGGFVTATFAGRHPERVRSLTLIDPAAGDAEPLPWYLRLPWLGPMMWQALLVPGMARGQLTDFRDPARWPEWPDLYRPQMRFRGFGRALWSSAMTLSRTDLDSVYATVGQRSMPVMLLWGKDDHTVPIENADRVRRAIPRAEYHPIDGAAHLPHMERSDTVGPLMLTFLRAHLDD